MVKVFALNIGIVFIRSVNCFCNVVCLTLKYMCSDDVLFFALVCEFMVMCTIYYSVHSFLNIILFMHNDTYIKRHFSVKNSMILSIIFIKF